MLLLLYGLVVFDKEQFWCVGSFVDGGGGGDHAACCCCCWPPSTRLLGPAAVDGAAAAADSWAGAVLMEVRRWISSCRGASSFFSINSNS